MELPQPKHSQRGANGRFVRGNTATLIHGLRSEADKRDELPAEYRYLQEQVGAFVRECVSDEGGDERDIPARRRALLEYRARLHRRILQLDTALELHGVIDRRHKLRGTWLTKLVTMIATARNIDALLGLDRKERDITTLSAADWAAHVEPRRPGDPVNLDTTNSTEDPHEAE